MNRITDSALAARVTTAERAAEHIRPGDTVGMSGFTGAGHPKAVPAALAARIESAHAAGEYYRIAVLSGASTGEEVDGAQARVNGIAKRAPFVYDPDRRRQINAGDVEYTDIHLSHLAQQVWFGFHGNLDVAVVEVAAV